MLQVATSTNKRLVWHSLCPTYSSLARAVHFVAKKSFGSRILRGAARAYGNMTLERFSRPKLDIFDFTENTSVLGEFFYYAPDERGEDVFFRKASARSTHFRRGQVS